MTCICLKRIETIENIFWGTGEISPENKIHLLFFE